MARRVARKPKRREPALSREEIDAARAEAKAQVLRRDQHNRRMAKLQEVEAVQRMLEDHNHPVWWAISFTLLPHFGEVANESLHDAVVRIGNEVRGRVRDAFNSARALLMYPVLEQLGGKKLAREEETEKEALTRILIERKASSYAAVKAAGDHDPRVHSAGLPQKDVRAARRLAAKLRTEAAQRHATLAATVVPHRPVLVGAPLDHIKDGLLALLDQALRNEEREQAEIVRNIDSHRRGRSRRTE